MLSAGKADYVVELIKSRAVVPKTILDDSTLAMCTLPHEAVTFHCLHKGWAADKFLFNFNVLNDFLFKHSPVADLEGPLPLVKCFIVTQNIE